MVNLAPSKVVKLVSFGLRRPLNGSATPVAGAHKNAQSRSGSGRGLNNLQGSSIAVGGIVAPCLSLTPPLMAVHGGGFAAGRAMETSVSRIGRVIGELLTATTLLTGGAYLTALATLI
jgi:hypothetical protein